MGGKSSPPPPPDYGAIAQQQAVANKETAAYNSAINRVDQYTPTGSSTWTIRPGADPNNPKPGDYIQTTALSAPQQSMQDAQDRIGQNLAGVAESGLSRVGAQMATPFNTSGINPIQQSLTPAGTIDRSISTTGLPQLPGSGGYADQVKAVQDAVYSRMAPQLARSREQTENSLLNSGIEKGTQAWDDAQRVLSQKENDANTQAILAGSQEQSRLANLDQSARGQLFGENAANVNVNNAGQAQQFNQGLSSATFGNQAAGQAMQQQQALRQLPLNELNALRTGAQVTSPQFSGYYTGGQTQAADLMGAANNSYNAAIGNTNASNAAAGQTTAAVGTVAAAALMAF